LFQTGVRHHLNAYHALVGDFGEETTPHTHPYLVEWTVSADHLDENGFATDISAMEETIAEELARVDGVLLNDLEFFAERQTSLENLCLFLHQRLAASLAAKSTATWSPSGMEVKIWESDTAWASYRS
jgi:6-pyruvoyl-tetrahydropterin synthase